MQHFAHRFACLDVVVRRPAIQLCGSASNSTSNKKRMTCLGSTVTVTKCQQALRQQQLLLVLEKVNNAKVAYQQSLENRIHQNMVKSCCHEEQACKHEVSGNSTCLSESLHVILSCHFQHGTAAAHANVMFNKLDASTVQGLDIKVLS